jgi:hypothetical protein
VTLPRAVLVVVALTGALSLGLTSAASTAVENPYPGRVGLGTHTFWLSPAEGYAYLRRARLGGITWVREDIVWAALEPRRGRFNWRRSDALMRNAARLGVNVLALVTYAPGWANGHGADMFYPPTNPGDYGMFVGALLARYAKGGTFWAANPRLQPRPLTAIEIWNEPWLWEFWRPNPDPAAYARLVRAAGEAAEASHPEVRVIASADITQHRSDTSEYPAWFSTLLQADPALWTSSLVDGWSVHLYTEERSPWDSQAEQRWRYDRVLLTNQLAQDAQAAKPIWTTELGWRTGSGAADDVSESAQAEFERGALVRAVREWGTFVARSFVFVWGQPHDNAGYNLIRQDGSTRPAWDAIKDLIATGD